ncbi:MAG: universal stress protein [Deltaproteobacteria bacterium]|nr:universal stress protein [Deltaproteobacteria bacterium]
MTIKTLAVGTDFSELGNAGVRDAVSFARTMGAERLHVVHVVGSGQAAATFPYSITAEQLLAAHEEAARNAEARLAEVTRSLSGLDITTEVRVGIPAREIVSAAEAVSADLLFVSTHGYGGFRRLMLGSVASSVVRAAHCPTYVVGPERAYRPAKNVLAAVDLSLVSADVVRSALQMARAVSGQVRVVSLFEHPLVYVPDGEVFPRYFSEADGQKLEAKHADAVWAVVREVGADGVDVQVDAMSKLPASLAILEVAALVQPDLIVIGSSGHNAWHRMILGSTAGRVVAEATAPVLVVPHEGDRKPS